MSDAQLEAPRAQRGLGDRKEALSKAVDIRHLADQLDIDADRATARVNA
jgi:hypothetical protein